MLRGAPIALLALAPLACRGTESSADSADAEARERDSTIQIAPGRTTFVRGAPAGGRAPRVVKGTRLAPPVGDDGRDGVLVFEGLHGATIDLDGLDLRGSPVGTDLDRDRGVGLRFERCEDVTVKGGRIGGYKVCVLARECRNLTLQGMRFESWYGMRLRSSAAAEDPSDWLYPHENDAEQWNQTYGAAISLVDCRDAIVADCRGRKGQNGILLTRTNGARIHGNDFSFLSGWGLALYRSSKNVVARNVFDYCVRGYSHDVYWRGQDSAGILMFERCSDNLLAENSATHGGDGLFLFAGNDTVEGRAFEKGEKDAGGSDRNVWCRNDFSFAVANAIETTFSRDNWAIENRLNGSHQHGIWGGYSARLVVLRNEISGTIGGAISIEHGQECAIVENEIRDSDQGVELWWDDDAALVGGPFGKHRDTSSRDHLVLGNRFAKNAQDVVITKTRGVTWARNGYESARGLLTYDKLSLDGGENTNDRDASDLFMDEYGRRPSGRVVESSVRDWKGAEPEWLAKARAWRCPELPGKPISFARDREGLDTIVVGEWGPWDFRSGEPRPVQREPGGLLADARWDATWFSWGGAADPDPRESVEAWRMLAAKPLATAQVRAWTNPWGGDRVRQGQVGTRRFGVLARARFELRESGAHELAVTSDDGVRVKVDGRTVIEDWTWHAAKVDKAELDLARGEHEIELEYFQIDGGYALSVDLVRAE